MTVNILSSVASLPVASRAETLKAVAVALFLGLGLVYFTGFANIDAAHDAAHDTRHALSFPCH
jgi:cobalt transporter subunit CbtB